VAKLYAGHGTADAACIMKWKPGMKIYVKLFSDFFMVIMRWTDSPASKAAWMRSFYGSHKLSGPAPPKQRAGLRVAGGFCRPHLRQIPAHGLAIHPNFAGNPAFGPALFMQGCYRLLLIHFEFVHPPIVPAFRERQLAFLQQPP
jgi:hypothetical protein